MGASLPSAEASPVASRGVAARIRFMLLFELRTAWRSLRARPAFSGLVVGVLAIGLGCVLHVAGMINGLIVEPLPIHSPEQLFDAGLIDNDAPPNAHRFDA
jgi:hypothetical protein